MIEVHWWIWRYSTSSMVLVTRRAADWLLLHRPQIVSLRKVSIWVISNMSSVDTDSPYSTTSSGHTTVSNQSTPSLGSPLPNFPRKWLYNTKAKEIVNRTARYKRVVRDCRKGITNAAIRRLARRGEIQQIDSNTYPTEAEIDVYWVSSLHIFYLLYYIPASVSLKSTSLYSNLIN